MIAAFFIKGKTSERMDDEKRHKRSINRLYYPGQVLLHPDGKTLFIVCSHCVQIRHYCLGCFHVNIPSSMKQHICSYGNLGRASTAVNGINESLSRLHLDYQLPGTQSTKTKDKWSTSEVKIWIENNANRDPLTRQIIRNGIRYLASTRWLYIQWSSSHSGIVEWSCRWSVEVVCLSHRHCAVLLLLVLAVWLGCIFLLESSGFLFFPFRTPVHHCILLPLKSRRVYTFPPSGFVEPKNTILPLTNMKPTMITLTNNATTTT